MPDRVGWRHYPAGLLGSLVRGVSSALISVPLIAIVMILPFLTIWLVADRAAFGAGVIGLAWSAWAELAVGIATAAFALGALVVAVLNAVRTVATIGALRRAIRRGADASQVPHPQQWELATGWSGASLIISALITTAVLTFPGVLTAPVRAWVVAALPTQEWRLAGIPVAAIGLIGIFRSWRKRMLKELEARWPQTAREAAVAAAEARVPNLPTDADGDRVNPATTYRSPLDRTGDWINSAGLWITGVAVLGAAVTLPVGASMIGSGVATTTAERLTLLSSVLLLAISIALYLLGGLLQNSAQLTELRGLLAVASRPYGPVPELSVLARYWRPLEHPWVNFLGLVGALAFLLAVPMLLMSWPQAAGRWGAAGGVLAGAMLLVGAVLDVAAEHGTRERRNVIMWQWPIPDPSSMNNKEHGDGAVDAAVEADVDRYDRHFGAGPHAAMAAQQYPTPPAQPDGPPTGGPAAPHVGGPYAPPSQGALPPPVNGGYQPPPATGPYPSPPANGAYPLPAQAPGAAGAPPATGPYAPPVRPAGSRRAWGLPKKLRGRGLGDLYH